jgi:hypothetical protein
MTSLLDNAAARAGPAPPWPAGAAASGDAPTGAPATARAATAAPTAFLRVVRERDRLVQDGDPAAEFGPPAGDDAIGWARWRWNGRAVVAETCRYGIRPLYYHASADRIMVAPSVATLLALGAPADLDAEALAVFLRFENFLGEDTPFKHIRALPPAGRLEWSGALHLSGDYWQPAAETASRESALGAYAARFRAAVERAVGTPSVVPLSGGCDSRHIAFELARRSVLRECVSIRSLPPRTDADPAVAARVAAALGARCIILDQDPDRFTAIARATEETSYCGREHAWFRPLAAYLRNGAAVDRECADAPVVDGLGGDVLSAGLFLEATALDLFRRGLIAELARHYMRGHLHHLPFVAEPDLAPAGLAATRLMRELERHRGASNPVGSFFFWNRTRRVVALQFRALLPQRTVLAPYLDLEVFALLAGLPAEMFLDHRFHREALHRAFPQYAAIDFSVSGHQARWSRASRNHFRRYGRAILDRLDSHPSRLIDTRYAKPRIRYLAWTGSPASWTADACLYLSQLEYAGQPVARGAAA